MSRYCVAGKKKALGPVPQISREREHPEWTSARGSMEKWTSAALVDQFFLGGPASAVCENSAGATSGLGAKMGKRLSGACGSEPTVCAC